MTAQIPSWDITSSHMVTQVPETHDPNILAKTSFYKDLRHSDPNFLANLALPQPPSEGFQLSQSGPPPRGPTYNGETEYPWQQTRRINAEGLHVIQLDGPRDIEANKAAAHTSGRRRCPGGSNWKWVVCALLCVCIVVGLCVAIPVYLHQQHRGDSPTAANHTTTNHLVTGSPLTVSSLLAIAPASNTCAGATHSLECKTAQEALAPILASFATYKITDPAIQAAVVSTIAMESGDFKYAHHYFPSSVPGQGTRNMQSAAYNLEYAQSIPDLAGKLEAAQAAGPEHILDLLTSNSDYDFGSAAWYLTSQCDKGVVSGLSKAGTAAFDAYLGCIGATGSAQRTEYYTTALKTFGVA